MSEKIDWEEQARIAEAVAEQQMERRMERSFRKQVVELANEGIGAEVLAEKLGADIEIIEDILKEELWTSKR